MIHLFLKAKHWQLFIWMFGIPMVFQFLTMYSMIFDMGSEVTSDSASMFNYMKFFPLMMIIFMGTFFGWFWAIAIGLQKKVPQNVKMKVIKFKIFFFFVFIYILLFLTGFMFIMSGLFESNQIPNFDIIWNLFWIIIPLHFFSMFCILYVLYFVAKTFKTVELQREVKFADFAGEFMMIWFYPLGIWIIQPKINKMVEE